MNSSGRLRGRTVVVTGAASGIGAAVARGVVAEGGVAACVDVNLDGARAVADSLDAAFALSCDVTVLRDVQA